MRLFRSCALMKRLTIAMGDELYTELVEYAADESKRKVRRLSLGEAARTLISAQLAEFGYERALGNPTSLSPTARKLK